MRLILFIKVVIVYILFLDSVIGNFIQAKCDVVVASHHVDLDDECSKLKYFSGGFFFFYDEFWNYCLRFDTYDADAYYWNDMEFGIIEKSWIFVTFLRSEFVFDSV